MSGPPAATSAAVGEEAGPSHQNAGRWSKSISEKDTVLAIQVAAWLRKRGKALRPKLNDEQKQQLEGCFELMDADGSGAIDADELGAAFKLLGLQVKRAEIGELLAEVDSDGSGEVEYPEFIEIMTSTLAKLAEKKEQEGSAGNQVPFALLATAYRRKRIMEGLISGDMGMTAQVVAIAEEAARRAAEEAAAHQAQHGHHHTSHHASTDNSHSSSRNSSANGSEQQWPAPGSCKAENSRCSSSSDSSKSSSSNANLRAAQAAAPQGLLRSLQKLKSMKNSSALLEALTESNSSSCAVGAGNVGDAGAGCGLGLSAAFGGDLAAVLGEQEHAQLVEMLRQGAQQRLNSAHAASTPAAGSASATCLKAGDGRYSPGSGRRYSPEANKYVAASAAAAAAAGRAATAGCTAASGRNSPSSTRGAARPTGQPGALEAPAAALVAANQHITSKLQQKVLTQEVQLPKYALSNSRSGPSSPAAAATDARSSSSSSRAQSTSSSPVPLNPASPARHSGASPGSNCRQSMVLRPLD